MMITKTYNIEDLPSKIDPPLYPYGRNVDGYGRKIATARMVQLPGSKRWRRVYCCIYSNIGTCYVTDGDNWIVIR